MFDERDIDRLNSIQPVSEKEPTEGNIVDDVVERFGKPTYAPYQDETGFFADTGRALKQGSLQGLRYLGDTLDLLDVQFGRGLSDYATQKLREISPDYSEAYDLDSTPYKWYKSAVGSLPVSLGIMGLGVVDPVLGLLGLSTVGGGTYSQGVADYIAAHPEDILGAQKYGAKVGSSEVISELVTDLIPFGIGRFARFGGSKAAVDGLGKLVGRMSPKEIAKIGATSFGLEGGSEALNAYYQTLQANKAGLTDVDPMDAALNALGPSAFLSLGFSAGGIHLASSARNKLRKQLNNLEDPAARVKAATEIYSQLKKTVDPETADLWFSSAVEAVNEGLEIPVEASFDDFYKLLDEYRTGLPPTEEEIQKASVEELKAYVDSELKLQQEGLKEREKIREVRKGTPGVTRSIVRGDTSNAMERLEANKKFYGKKNVPSMVSPETLPVSQKSRNDAMDIAMTRQEPEVKSKQPEKTEQPTDSLPLIKRARVVKLLPEDLQPIFSKTEDPQVIESVYQVMNTKRNLQGKLKSLKNVKQRSKVIEEIKTLDKTARDLLVTEIDRGAAVAIDNTPQFVEPKYKPEVDTTGSQFAITDREGLTGTQYATKELKVPKRRKVVIKKTGGPTTAVYDNLQVKGSEVKLPVATDTSAVTGEAYDSNGELIATTESPEDLLIKQESGGTGETFRLSIDNMSPLEKAFATQDVEAVKKALSVELSKKNTGRKEYRKARAAEIKKENPELTYDQARDLAEKEYAKKKKKETLDQLAPIVAEDLNLDANKLAALADVLASKNPKKWPTTIIKEAASELLPGKKQTVSQAVSRAKKQLDDKQGGAYSKASAYKALLDSVKDGLTGYSLDPVIIGSDFYHQVLGEERVSRSGNTAAKSRIEQLQEQYGLSKADAETAAIIEDQIKTLSGEDAKKTKEVYKQFLSERKTKGEIPAENIKEDIKTTGEELQQEPLELKVKETKKPVVIRRKKKTTVRIDAKKVDDELKNLTDQVRVQEFDEGPNIQWQEAVTVGNLLDIILDTDGVPEHYRAVAQLIKTAVPDRWLDNTLIREQTFEEYAEYASAFYSPDFGEIAFKRNTSVRVALHEIIHSVTANALRTTGKTSPLHKRLTVARNLLANALVDMGYLSESDIYIAVEGGKVLKNALSEDSKFTLEQKMYLYALSSNDELMSMALTMPHIQAIMKHIKVPAPKISFIRSMWDLVVDTVGRLFKIKSKQEWHLLSEVLDITVTLGQLPNHPLAASRVLEDYWSQMKADGKLTAEERYARYRQRLIELEKQKTTPNRLKNALVKLVSKYDKYLEPIDERIARISPRLSGLINKMEAKKSILNKRYAKAVEPFLKKYHAISDPIAKKELALALFNSHHSKDAKVLQQLLVKHGMVKEFNEVQKVVKEIHKRMEAVGIYLFRDPYDIYYPRRVADIKGLYRYLTESRHSTHTGYFDDILNDKKLTDEQKQQLIAARINSGYHPAKALSIPTSAKSRKIPYVTPETLQFYEDPVLSLRNTIMETNEAIATRELVGVRERKKLQDQINRLWDLYKKTPASNKTKKKKLYRRIQAKLLKIRDIQDVSDESISSFINKNAKDLTSEQVENLMNALRARLNQRGMHGGLAKVRDVGLVFALGSYLNAITQLADIVWTTYKNGPITTMQALIGKKEISADDFDIEHIMQQFDTAGFQRALDRVLTLTAFKWVDKFGKTTSMQASILKARKISKDTFVSKWGQMFSDEIAGKIWEDIQAGRVTDKVRYYVFTDVSKFQPISLSQMPAAYLTAGNGRIFYTLKSYAIKQLSNLRRESITEIAKGNRAEGIKNLMILLTLLTLANAGTDEIKDFLLGRDNSLSDHVMDNLLSIAFINRYTMAKGEQRGYIRAFLSDVLIVPGFTFMDPFLKDVANFVRSDKELTYSSIASIPFFGRIVYYDLTRQGKLRTLKNMKRSIYDEVRDGASFSDLRTRIVKYNKKARSLGEKPITAKSLRKVRSRYKKKLKKSMSISSLFSPREAHAGTNVDTEDYTDLVRQHSTRLQVDPEKAMSNLWKFSQFVAQVESDFNPKAKNKTTSASGMYQFVRGSVEPAINRLSKYIGMRPWMVEVLKTKDASQLTPEQQTLLFLGDILEKRGSDQYMKKIMESADPKSMLLAYYKLHHTAPDNATRKRAVRILKEHV